MNKPPLGLTPEHIFNTMQNTERIAEIIAAMKRYSEATRPIPVVWIEELERRIFYGEGSNE